MVRGGGAGEEVGKVEFFEGGVSACWSGGWRVGGLWMVCVSEGRWAAARTTEGIDESAR